MARQFRIGGAVSSCTPAVTINNISKGLRRGAGDVEHDCIKDTADIITHSWTTEPGYISLPDWPQGDYKGSGYFSRENGTVTYKIQLLRVGPTCGPGETIGTSSSIDGAGAQSYTVVDYNPSAGNVRDRYQMRILATNTSLHQNRWLRVDESSADSYLEAPFDASPFVQDSDNDAGSDVTTVGFDLYQPATNNRVLVVFVWNYDSAESVDITNVTYDGISLTHLITQTGGTYSRMETWYLPEADFNTDIEELNTLVATFASEVDEGRVIAVMFENANQSFPHAHDGSEPVDTSVSNSITTTTANVFGVDGISYDHSSRAYDLGQDRIEIAGIAVPFCGVSLEPQPAAGELTMGWSGSISSLWLHRLVGVAPPSTGVIHEGAAVLTGEASIVAVADIDTSAAAVLTGEALITAVAKMIYKAAASITGEASIIATAKATVPATATLTGEASIIADGKIEKQAAAVITGEGSITAAATMAYAAAVVLTGQALISAAAKVTHQAAAILTGEATIVADAKASVPAAAVLTGEASISATGQLVKLASAALTGEASIVAIADIDTSAVAVLTAAATIVAAAKVTHPASAVLTGEATVQATAKASVPAAAVLTAAATIIAAAKVTHPASAVLTGEATIQAIAKATVPAAAVMTGEGSVTAVATVTHKATAILTGAAIVQAVAKVTHQAAAVLTAEAEIVADATVITGIQLGEAILTGAAEVVAAAKVTRPASSIMTGDSNIIAVGDVVGRASAVLIGTAEVAATAKVIRSGSATLEGVASITAVGRTGRIYLTERSATKSYWGRQSDTESWWGRLIATKRFWQTESDTKG